MRKAIDEACQGVEAGDGGPFGAVVVKDGKIVATGHNMVSFPLPEFFRWDSNESIFLRIINVLESLYLR
ncbi:unnamed protein product [Haemonchus placei]|uniref:CMP/dCMP-type deaminase domain-containing protein n=1 Tax=Haemonchus placei TaxID=6290 RepID=A0A0N4XAN4_HAEPC|nr:unnamed protein product [Haemonchus placei]